MFLPVSRVSRLSALKTGTGTAQAQQMSEPCYRSQRELAQAKRRHTWSPSASPRRVHTEGTPVTPPTASPRTPTSQAAYSPPPVSPVQLTSCRSEVAIVDATRLRSHRELAHARKVHTLSVSPSRENLHNILSQSIPLTSNPCPDVPMPSPQTNADNTVRLVDATAVRSHKELAHARKLHTLSVSPSRETLHNILSSNIAAADVAVTRPVANEDNTVTPVDAAALTSFRELRHAKKVGTLTRSQQRKEHNDAATLPSRRRSASADVVLVRVSHPCTAREVVVHSRDQREWKYHPQEFCANNERVLTGFSSAECLRHEKQAGNLAIHNPKVPPEQERVSNEPHHPGLPKQQSNKHLRLMTKYHATPLYPTGRFDAAAEPQQAAPAPPSPQAGAAEEDAPWATWQQPCRRSLALLESEKRNHRRSFSAGASSCGGGGGGGSGRSTGGGSQARRRSAVAPSERYTSQDQLRRDKALGGGTALVMGSPARVAEAEAEAREPSELGRCSSQSAFQKRKRGCRQEMHGGPTGETARKSFASSSRRSASQSVSERFEGLPAGMQTPHGPPPAIFARDSLSYGVEQEARGGSHSPPPRTPKRGASVERRSPQYARAGKPTDTATPDKRALRMMPSPVKSPIADVPTTRRGASRSKSPMRMPVGHSIVPVNAPPAYVGIRHA